MIQRIASLVGNILMLPLYLMRHRVLVNVAYTRVLKMVIATNVPYAIDTSNNSVDSSQKFFRPAEAFETRYGQVRATVEEAEADNLLDIGCAEGYMISRISKDLGTFAVGLEMDRQRIRAGNAQSDLDNDTNYGIVPASVNPEMLARVPKFDVVVCFSVLHHIIRHHGKDEGIEFLRAIRNVTRHRFLFDMGGPEEVDNDPEWGNVLAFMKDDVIAANIELLELAGFVDIRHIGDTPGYIPTATRPLFVCSPQK